MAPLKQKGDLAELKIACDLVERGWKVAVPYGEDSDVDLIAYREDWVRRVQVKYACSDGEVIVARPKSLSLTNGKVRRVKRYTSRTIDWLAIWDRTTGLCLYMDAAELGGGRSILHFRLAPAANNQATGVRFADQYLEPPDRPPAVVHLFP